MHDARTRQAGATFAELICADDQWLHDEFDALIAANYQPPGRPVPAPPRTPPLPPHRRGTAPLPAAGTWGRGTITTRGSTRRQRAPPPTRT
ncbi:MAG TPA: hypothetical protein VGH27_02580 [Streptosporangiaceae bacterium]|jgi:hypothetical protein